VKRESAETIARTLETARESVELAKGQVHQAHLEGGDTNGGGAHEEDAGHSRLVRALVTQLTGMSLDLRDLIVKLRSQ
jgi:hypothetical protein